MGIADEDPIKGEAAGGLAGDPLRRHKSAHDKNEYLRILARPSDRKAILRKYLSRRNFPIPSFQLASLNPPTFAPTTKGSEVRISKLREEMERDRDKTRFTACVQAGLPHTGTSRPTRLKY